MGRLEQSKIYKEQLPNKNIESFLTRYQQEVMEPMILYFSPSRRTNTIRSPKKIIDTRTNALRTYLNRRDMLPYDWGRTLLAEIMAEEILKGLPMFQNGYQLSSRLSPPYFDKTAYTPFYQKGGDIVITQKQEDITLPLLIIDVTLGSPEQIDEKKSKLGLHEASATPVIVLPLAHIGLKNKSEQEMSFSHFLDSTIRGQIQRNGYFIPPLYNLEFLKKYRQTMYEYMQWTDQSLQQVNGSRGQTTYTALKKLQLMKKLLNLRN